MLMDKLKMPLEKNSKSVNRFLKIFGIILVGVLLGVGQIASPGFICLLSIYIILGYLLWKYSKEEDKRFILILFVSGILLRVVLSLFLYSQSYAQGYSGFSSGDAAVYSERAWQIAQFWLDPDKYSFPRIRHGINGYTYIIAFFYSLFGYSPLVAKFINCLLGTASGILIFYITKDIFNAKIAKLSAIFVVFSPSLIRWSIDTLKDPLVIFLIILFFWILKKFQEKKWFFLIPSIFVVILLKILGNPLYTILLFILVYAFFIVLRLKPLKIVGLIFLVFSVILFSNLIDLNPRDLAQELIKKAAHYQKMQAVSDEAGYLIYENTTAMEGRINLISIPLSYIKGLSYALFSPFPWAITSRLQLFAYPQILMWYFLFPFTIIGIILTLRYKTKDISPLIIYIFLSSSLLALAEGNIGGVFRHRDWISPFFLMFAAIGLIWVFGKKEVELWS